METTKNLLLNLSLLLVLSFFFQIWMENKKDEKLGVFSIHYFIISLIICALLSFKVGDEFRFDLRQVPFIIAGLYLERGMILLLAIALTLRAVGGINEGFWLTALIYPAIALFTFSVRKWFNKQNVDTRLLTIVCISAVSSLLIMAGMDMIVNPISNFEQYFAYFIIPAVGSLILSYMIEMNGKNSLLRQKVEQSIKTEMVSHMSAAISHEIRNPLTAARGFLQLVIQNEKLDRKDGEYLGIALQEMDRAEQVIRNYLTYAKPTIETVVSVDVDSELGHVLNVLEPLANLNSVEVETDIHSLSFIEGDRNKFQQCMLNIIKNALEAMSAGGVLRVESKVKAEYIYIEISDSGTGMTEEQLKRLGEPYYSTKEGKGTGLGMMVVYSLISAMKGEIQVESQIGKGTTFTIIFPCAVVDVPVEVDCKSLMDKDGDYFSG
ncbi:ATP-binding protein [Peribacillus sp. SCS-26]|uniref:ATP-binding protein n=1 Tax=Paraperibacillus marinus TaxID=3115295 RepID=UPI0039066EF5